MNKGSCSQGNVDGRRIDRYKRFKRSTFTKLSKMKSNSQLYATRTGSKMTNEMMTLKTKIMYRNSYNLQKSFSFSDSDEKDDIKQFQNELEVDEKCGVSPDDENITDHRDSPENGKHKTNYHQKVLLTKKKMAKELFTLRSKLRTRNAYNLQTKGGSLSDTDDDFNDEIDFGVPTTDVRSEENEKTAKQLREFLRKKNLAKELFTLRTRMLTKSCYALQDPKNKSLSLNDLPEETENKTTLNEQINEKILTLDHRRESVPNKFRLKIKEQINEKRKLVSETISKYSCSNIRDKTPLISDDATYVTQELGDLQITTDEHRDENLSPNENIIERVSIQELDYTDDLDAGIPVVIEETDKNDADTKNVINNTKKRKLKKLLTNIDLRQLLKTDVISVEKSNNDSTGLLDGD